MRQLYILLIIGGMLIVCFLQGCKKNDICLRENLEEYPCHVEMIADEVGFKSIVETILKDDCGIKKLTKVYVTEGALKRHVASLCWALSAEVEEGSRRSEEVIGLALLMLSDDDERVSGFAGASLVYVPDFALKDVFVRLIEQEGVYTHGIRGLLRIGTYAAIERVLDTVEVVRKDKKDVWCKLINILCQEGLPGETKTYVTDLLEKGALDDFEAIKELCKEALQKQ